MYIILVFIVFKQDEINVLPLTSRLIVVAYTCSFIYINSKCPESKKKSHMQTNTFYLMFQRKVE